MKNTMTRVAAGAMSGAAGAAGRARDRGIAFWVLAVCLLGGAAGLLLHLGSGMRVSWQSILFGIPLAILQAALLIGILRLTPLWRGVPAPAHYHGDPVQPEPLTQRSQRSARLGWPTAAAALLWGAGVAIMVVPFVASPMKGLVNALNWAPAEASLAGAWPEEFIKGIGIALILLGSSHLSRPWQGLLVGALVGLGFDVQENLMYGYVEGLAHPDSDAMGMATTWLMRLVAGPYLHACWSALMGWGVGLAFFGWRARRAGEAAQEAHRAQSAPASRAWPAVVWMLAALALHFSWNLSIEDDALAVVVMVGVALASYGLVIGLIVGQSRWLRAHSEHGAQFA